MKYYKNKNNAVIAFELECFDDKGEIVNQVCKDKIENENAVEISEEEAYLILDKLKPTKNEIRKAEIIAELESLDIQTIRPLRAVLSGLGTDIDKARLAELETKAKALRTELSTL